MNSSIFYTFVGLGGICGIISLAILYVLAKNMIILQDKVYPHTFKIHTTNTARCGGIGIFLSLVALVIGGIEITYTTDTLVKATQIDSFTGLRLYIACFIILASGILKDNNKNYTIGFSFIVQIIGISYFVVTLCFLLPISLALNVLEIITCVIFLFCAIHSFNIIDGIHGNAILTCLLIIISLSYISFQLQINFISFACALLLGVSLVFLCFNFPYGKMFLGDSGAFLLGFLLAALLFIGVVYYDINPYYAFMLFIYPFCEMLVSLSLKLRYSKMCSLSEAILHLCEPNNYHLHYFLYARFKHYAAIAIHIVYGSFIFFITFYYNNTLILFYINIIFFIVYGFCFYIFRLKNLYLYHKT